VTMVGMASAHVYVGLWATPPQELGPGATAPKRPALAGGWHGQMCRFTAQELR